MLQFLGALCPHRTTDRGQPGEPIIRSGSTRQFIKQATKTTTLIKGRNEKRGTDTMGRFDVTTADYADMASTGNSEVLYELGLIYATGRDGVLDMIAAHKWFNLAAFRGNGAAKARREEIAVEMTSAQIAEAQRAAREWITQH